MEISRNSLAIAQKILGCDDDEWPAIIQNMRINRELFPFVADLNEYLRTPGKSAEIAQLALERIGLIPTVQPKVMYRPA